MMSKYFPIRRIHVDQETYTLLQQIKEHTVNFDEGIRPGMLDKQHTVIVTDALFRRLMTLTKPGTTITDTITGVIRETAKEMDLL